MTSFFSAATAVPQSHSKYQRELSEAELTMRDYGGFVYVLASKRNGTLYIGVTNDLIARVHAHKSGAGSKFVQRYAVHRLVWYAFYDRIEAAIQRETTMKKWPRTWKLNVIEEMNPQWRDLYEDLIAEPALPDWAK